MPHIMGVQQITYQELDTYLRLTGQHLYNWEVKAIKRLDTEYALLLMEHSRNGNHSRVDF